MYVYNSSATPRQPDSISFSRTGPLLGIDCVFPSSYSRSWSNHSLCSHPHPYGCLIPPPHDNWSSSSRTQYWSADISRRRPSSIWHYGVVLGYHLCHLGLCCRERYFGQLGVVVISHSKSFQRFPCCIPYSDDARLRFRSPPTLALRYTPSSSAPCSSIKVE